jgi:hypothetical protein
VTVVAGGLITLEFALEGLNYGPLQPLVNGELSTRDADVAAYIKAATPVLEKLTGPLISASRVRSFNGGKSGIALTESIASAAAVTSITEDGSPITDYVVDVDAGIIYAGAAGARRKFATGSKNIVVSYTAGAVAIHPTLQLAARELVRHLIQVGKQAPSPAFDPTGSGGVDASAIVPMGFAVPRRVAELCEPFRQVGFA